MKIILVSVIFGFLVSCHKNEKHHVQNSTEVLQNQGDTTAPISLKNYASNALNPGLDMDKVFSNLVRKRDEKTIKYKDWLEGMTINTFNSDNDHEMLSAEVKELWRDMKDLEYEEETQFTRAMFDKKWKDKLDYSYLAWYQIFYDGQDGPEKVKLIADQIGTYNNSYYYKITVSDVNGDREWPSQSGKIFKVEAVNGKPLITGIYLKGESLVWGVN